MNGHQFYFLSLRRFLSFSLSSLHTLKLLDSAAGRCVYAVVQTVCVGLTVEIEMVGRMVSATNKNSSAVGQLGYGVLANSSTCGAAGLLFIFGHFDQMFKQFDIKLLVNVSDVGF